MHDKAVHIFLWHRCIFGAGDGKSTFSDPYLMISNGDWSRELECWTHYHRHHHQPINWAFLACGRSPSGSVLSSSSSAHTGTVRHARKSRLFMALGEFYGLRSLRSGLCKRQSRWGKEAVGQLGRKRAEYRGSGSRHSTCKRSSRGAAEEGNRGHAS